MKHWQDKPLTAATPSALRTWIGDMHITAKFARHLLTPLRSVFEDALNDDLIAFNTGLRPGELQALRWAKIDFKAATARIDLNQVAGTEKAPKTEAGIRLVDLNGDALAALEAQKPASLLAGQHVWLNPRSGKAWISDAQLRKTLWQPLCERAGVRCRNPYQARRTYASALLTAGTNPWYVAQQLGHADVTMVFQIYGKFIAEDYQKPKAPKLRVIAGGDA